MALYPDKISTLFRECKVLENRERQRDRKLVNGVKTLESGNDRGKCYKLKCNSLRERHENLVTNQQNVDSHEVLSRDIEAFVSATKIRTASVEFANLSKMLALSRFEVSLQKIPRKKLFNCHRTH